MQDTALGALAAAGTPKAAQAVFALWPRLTATQRSRALTDLSANRAGAGAILAALESHTIAKAQIDAALLDRLQAVLGANDPALTQLVDSLGALFRPVLALDGSEAAWTQTDITLEGPCTIEAWVRLDPDKRKIGNADGLFGAPGQLDLNFFGEKPRVYAFPPLADVAVAKKPVMPGLWTHVAFTRDGAGIWRIYIDGELDATGSKAAPAKIEKARIGWTSAPGGPRGAMGEFRVWNRERTAEEIRNASDRSLDAGPNSTLKNGVGNGSSQLSTRGLVFSSATGDWGKLQAGAKVIKTSDHPPILSADEAAMLDGKYAKNRALAEKPGDVARGKVAAALCQACHLMGPTGGNIGPNLSGVGAMGTEAILRNLLQPNAAMENGYRIYRMEMKNGDLIDALFVSEDKDSVIIRLPGSEDKRVAKKDVRETKFLRRSLMPEGLLDTMTGEQVSDLFAYLKTLK
jgi:putative heme-binding domain-containing protein